MRIPAADLGLMAQHLATHEGVIHQFKQDYMIVQNPSLKKVLYTSITVMRNHVRVMLALIDPNQTGPKHLPDLHEQQQMSFAHVTLTEEEKKIALKARSTSKSMANNNFSSALMMKKANARQTHIEMALQQSKLQGMYDSIIQQAGGEFTPKATSKEQLLTVQNYLHVLNE
ncbi:hypothetical protein [Metabacillus endolithicus]|uniref:Spore coat protein n=1 Tax=Metabacillus endolithicus TaxID=1535204 RepID=A0ABW5C4P0_9BACI|nr:hypothetical protein [Metabacillus endolithicus]UPG62240.1 hypothetical protein MVE64_17135 [Metabacillus endolithicus]